MKLQTISAAALCFFMGHLALAAGPMSELEVLTSVLNSPIALTELKAMLGTTRWISSPRLAGLLADKLSESEVRDALKSPEAARDSLKRALAIARSDEWFQRAVASFLGQRSGYDVLVAEVRAETEALRGETGGVSSPTPFAQGSGVTGSRWSLSGTPVPSPRDPNYYEWYRAINAELEDAFTARNIPKIRALLADGADPNFRLGNHTVFSRAVDLNDRELVRAFLDDPRTDLNYSVNYGSSVMTLAVSNDNPEMIADLLLAGVSPFPDWEERGGYSFTRSALGTGESQRMIIFAKNQAQWLQGPQIGCIAGCGRHDTATIIDNLAMQWEEADARGDMSLARVIAAMRVAAVAGQVVPVIKVRLVPGDTDYVRRW